MIWPHLFLAAALLTADSSSLRLPADLEEDVVSQHMYRLYEKYNRGNHLKEGNTIRSFRASQGPADLRTTYQLNLTTLQDSEVILSATFHFLLEKHTHPKKWFCKRVKSPSCRSAAVHPSPSVSLLLRSVSSEPEIRSGSVGSLLGNVTFHPHRRGVWQMKDVTQVIKEAQHRGQLLVSVEIEQQPHRKPEEVVSGGSMPYVLMYANDQALAEPNSVTASLQRYDPFNEGPNSSAKLKGRVRRDANVLSDAIQNNELPEVEFKPSEYRKEDLWESDWYLSLKPKLKSEQKEKRRKNHEDGASKVVHQEAEEAPQLIKNEDLTATNFKESHTLATQKNEQKNERKEGKKDKEGDDTRSAVLSFDEQTMRKARRRQWGHSQDRRCSRRNLRVDFADIGWSDWVIAPKAFDAYFCSGTCGFPMPQVLRPSNHATIQSIVRAVGIIPGIPEPCCVPENMSSLAVLFQDESRNPVLKVYPNMSVQSCSCR
uniref:Growth/differentiation factor 10 n=1 Tax=Nothobranchius furzeri TaxID=105023 RepID=A0A1A8U6Q4_NOTFU